MFNKNTGNAFFRYRNVSYHRSEFLVCGQIMNGSQYITWTKRRVTSHLNTPDLSTTAKKARKMKSSIPISCSIFTFFPVVFQIKLCVCVCICVCVWNRSPLHIKYEGWTHMMMDCSLFRQLRRKWDFL